MTMHISVITPTYKRRAPLLLHLRSWQEQTWSNFEIVIVDNAADPDIERAVAEFNRTARIPARYVPEPRVGVVYARHTGAHAAKGDLLIFTDDDETAHPRLIERYATAFVEHPQMAAAGGSVQPVWESPPPAWLTEYIGDARMFPPLGLVDIYDEFRLDAKGFLFSGNMAIKRDVLFTVGGFNPELVGDLYFGDGEVGLYRKLWQHNMLIGYVPGAVIYHHIPAQRLTVDYLCRRMANEGAADIYTRYHPGIPDRRRLLMHAATVALRNCRHWARARLLRGRTDRRSIDVQTDAARTQAQVKYLVRLIFDKKLRALVKKKDWLNGLMCLSVSQLP
jgi:glycosyltransferase involved in cell wall biosynthesis